MSDTLTHRGRQIHAEIPRALLRDPLISMQAKALWCLLEDYCDKNDPVAWPSQATLAHSAGLSVDNGDKTIRRWLGELTSTGWIEIERTGRSLRHVMCWDNPRQPGDPLPDPRSTGSDGSSMTLRDGSSMTPQRGHECPTKKNQEEEPGEERRVSSSKTSRARTASNPTPAKPDTQPKPAARADDDTPHEAPQEPEPPDPRIEPAAQIIQKLTNQRPKPDQIQKLNQLARSGWATPEINRRLLHAQGATNRTAYLNTTLNDMLTTNPPAPPAATTRATAGQTQRPTPTLTYAQRRAESTEDMLRRIGCLTFDEDDDTGW